VRTAAPRALVVLLVLEHSSLFRFLTCLHLLLNLAWLLLAVLVVMGHGFGYFFRRQFADGGNMQNVIADGRRRLVAGFDRARILHEFPPFGFAGPSLSYGFQVIDRTLLFRVELA
jgi:hypothetical protein